MVNSGNHYQAALKGNQPNLYRTVTQQFIPHQTICTVNKGTQNEVLPVVV